MHHLISMLFYWNYTSKLGRVLDGLNETNIQQLLDVLLNLHLKALAYYFLVLA